MPEELLIRHCAPTLAGIKTGNLFSCPYEALDELMRDIRALNRMLVPKGLRVLPLRYMGSRALIYVFRPRKLRADLSRAAANEILRELGYGGLGSDQCVRELIGRFKGADAFPHEIGLFLSYPPEDVRGFMENKARNFKCVGCWKVYGDEKNALKRFLRYEKCTRQYCKQWACGVTLSGLAVAV